MLTFTVITIISNAFFLAGTQPEPATAESTKQAQTSTDYQQGLPKVSQTTQIEVMAGHKQVYNSNVKQLAIPSKPKSAKPHRTGGISSTTETSIQGNEFHIF